MTRNLIIVGAGGAGLEALLVARSANDCSWKIIGFADDALALQGQSLDGVRVLGSWVAVLELLRGQEVWFHCGIGSNVVRRRIAEQAEANGLKAATLVHPTAVIAASAVIGAGSYIAPQVFVGPEARIGRHVLVNVAASVGHHAVVDDFSQICPGARISGNVRLGAAAFIGSNGVVAPGVQVGEGATVGAASFAARDIPARATALGVPAKILAVPPAPV